MKSQTKTYSIKRLKVGIRLLQEAPIMQETEAPEDWPHSLMAQPATPIEFLFDLPQSF